jgi:exonuclease SbcC
VDLARDRALAAARAGGLVDLAAVATAVRDDARRQELEDYCRGHDSELATVREQLADPQLAAAVAGAAPDVAATAAAAAEQDERHLAAAAAVETADRCVLALTRLVRELADVLAERVPLARRHGTVDRLSRLAEGKSADNRLRMSLSAYVLAARLEQVAAAAGDRLERMSSGRFRLVHAAETSRGRGGLQLRVTDAWTGVERDPATLSGGESFTASLALALGLADVVTAEAGGSTLETLFVDEGFGSLDDETLDDVMGVLDGLRDGGRVVGVVSHVADLRQRIPVQLRVRKDRTGSTVLQ